MTQVDPMYFIEHFGKKGMKWGVRSKKAQTTRTRYSKAPKRLTSHELEQRIKRMETEKKYNDLNKRDVGKGTQITSQILNTSGKKVATTLITGAALFAVKKAIQKKFSEEAASMITKRGK